MVTNVSIDANMEHLWKLAEKTEVMMNQDLLHQINKRYSENERFLLALFTQIRKFIHDK